MFRSDRRTSGTRSAIRRSRQLTVLIDPQNPKAMMSKSPLVKFRPFSETAHRIVQIHERPAGNFMRFGGFEGNRCPTKSLTERYPRNRTRHG